MNSCCCGSRHREQNRAIERRAAAFQDMHRQPASGARERNPQRGRGGFGCRLFRSEQHCEGTASFSGELQPPQLGIFDGARPGEDCPACVRGQRLLHGPQCFLRGAGPDDDEPRKFDSGSGKRRCIRAVGGGDPHEPLARCRQAGKHGTEQAQFADAFVCGQNLGESSRRPASAGKFGVQPGKARRQARRGHAREPVAAPESRVCEQLCGKRRRVSSDADHRTGSPSLEEGRARSSGRCGSRRRQCPRWQAARGAYRPESVRTPDSPAAAR